MENILFTNKYIIERHSKLLRIFSSCRHIYCERFGSPSNDILKNRPDKFDRQEQNIRTS